MLSTLQKQIHTNLSFLKEKRLLVACSGGVDSVVLTHLFKELDFDIALAHCNFKLRGEESDGDAIFVRDLAKKLTVPFYAEIFNTESYGQEHKLSTQMAARELRYSWFSELLEREKFDYILTGHHADDDLETFLINLSRGTGLRGLTGIPLANNKVIRPLLPFHRVSIVAYAKENGLYWREDSSNKKTDYLRNRLRHDVIPSYKESTRDLLSNFIKTQEHLQDSKALVDDYLVLIRNLVLEETSEGIEIKIDQLKDLPNTKALLYEILHPYGFTSWKDIYLLLEGQSGKQVFSSSHFLLKNRDILLLKSLNVEQGVDEYYIQQDVSKLEEPISLNFEPVDRFQITNANTVYLDTERLSYPLLLRHWKEGDSFQPFGMKGKKKLSKFFKDEKLSLVAKSNTWVLCSNNEIVWVVGMRPDDRFKVTKNTLKITQIVYTPH